MAHRKVFTLVLITAVLLLASCNNITDTTKTLGISNENSEAISVNDTSSESMTDVTVKTKTISLLHYFSGALSGGIDELVLDFNEKQSDYFLKAIPIDHEAYKVSIIKSLDSQNPPELYSYWAGAKTIDIKDKLLPLDTIWADADLDSIFQDSVVQSAAKIEGHYYLLPITQHYVSFYYNKHVFEALSLSPPHNWDEFISICETLKANDITPIGLGSKSKWPSQFWFDFLLLRTAGPEYRNELMIGNAHYTDPEVKVVFDIWSDLVKNQYFNSDVLTTEWYETPLSGFSQNKIGMTLMGTWVINILQSDYNLEPDSDFGYFTFPLIDEQIPMTALGPIDGLIVPRDAVVTDGALEAIRFLSSASSQSAMAKGSGAFSPSNQVSKSIYLPLQQAILTDIQTQPFWAFNYDLATPPQVAEIGLTLFNEFFAFPDHYDTLLQEAEDKINQIFNTLD